MVTDSAETEVADRLERAQLVDDPRDAERQRLEIRARLLGDPVPETRIDRFVVLERIGAGGMGVVYAAYDPSLDRKVAIKVVRSWGTEEKVEDRERLVREARSLARLSHPHVVAVHEVGLYQDGVFIVMELVRGRTLREHLRADRTPWRDTVRAYVQAGEGLAAAHDAGVVHRDFKPDNAIVGNDGRVRVVDFGIARTRDVESDGTGSSRSGDTTPHTGTGARIGTPAYMAPEQRSGRPASAKSDQYGFCVALHEALTGVLPADDDTHARALLGKLPARLRRALARGLAERPADRFADMPALLSELRAALGPSRVRTAATITAITGVTAGALGLAWIGRTEVCPDPSAELVGVWSDAERAAVREAAARVGEAAPKTAEIALRELDRYALAWVAARRDTCEAHWVRHADSTMLFDKRMRCLDRDRRALGDVVGLLAESDPKTWLHAVDAVMGLAAVDACADVDALTNEVPWPTDPEAVAAIDRVHAQIDRASTLESLGRLADARALVEQAREEALGTGHRRTEAEALGALAGARDLQGREREAGELLDDAIWRAEAARADELAAELLAHRLRIAAKRGKGEEATALERRTTGVIERLGRASRVENELLRGRYELAALRSDFAAAEAFAREGIAVAERDGGERSLGVTNHLNSLGIAQAQRGQLAEAEQSFQRAIEIRREWQADVHPNLIAHRMGLAQVYDGQGRSEESRAILDSIVADSERSLAGPTPQVANAFVNLARLAQKAGDVEKARALLDRALAILEQTVGGEHPRMMPPLLLRGLLEQGLQRYDEARATFERVLAIADGLDPDHQYKRLVWNNLAVLELERGNATPARAYATLAVALQMKIHGAEHPDFGRYMYTLAQADLALGAIADATLHVREALPTLEAGGPPSAGSWAGAQFVLAQALMKQTPTPDRAGAIEAANRAIERFEAMKDTAAAARVRAFLDAAERP